MRNLVIDGKSLLYDFGVWINGDEVYSGAEPSIETVKIPGRNGDLIFSNRRFENFQLIYKCAIPSDFETRFKALRSFLYSNIGYRKIEDSYFPDHFRLGRISGNMNPSAIGWSAKAALFDITFDCKPQHYLQSGQMFSRVTNGSVVRNETFFDALPLIRVYGNGTLTVNGTRVVIAGNTNAYCDLDCEIQDAFYQTVNLNNKITVNDDRFPVLSPGNNAVSIGSGITRVELMPRWWVL